jgi:hypothetical protein
MTPADPGASSASRRPRPIVGRTRAAANAAAVSAATRIGLGAALSTTRFRVSVRNAPSPSIVRSSRRHPRKSRATRGSGSLVSVLCISITTRRSPSGSGIVGDRNLPVRSYQPAPTPIAMASASPPTNVSAGYLTSIRLASLRSRDMAASQARPRPSRSASLCVSTPPNAIRACRRASSGVRPLVRIRCSASISMWRSISRFIRASSSLRDFKEASSRAEYGVECGGEAPPALELSAECAPARHRDSVVARLAVVVGHAPVARDQAVFLEPLEGRVERPLVHGELASGQLLYPLADPPAVHRRERECFQDEEIERAAQGINGLAWRHRLLSLSRGDAVAPEKVPRKI